MRDRDPAMQLLILLDNTRRETLTEQLVEQIREAIRKGRIARGARLPSSRNLADQLSEYCCEGTYAYLLDRPTTVPLDSPLVIFDTRACPESQL